MDTYKTALKKYFGFDSLKPFQEKIMSHLNEDLLILSPTGSGKSLCYQLPAVLDNGLTIIISPLKSLIEDQIYQLKTKNINVDFLNSDINKKDRCDLYKKLKSVPEYHILYVTPEIMITDVKLIGLLKDLQKIDKLARFVIDEAHCVSTWGHDFRSSYLNLGLIKKQFHDIKIMALTATATPKVKEDIVKILEMNSPHIETSSFFRPNLALKIINRNDTNLSYLRDLINKNYSDMCGVIYCHSRRETERVADYLSNFITARSFHAGLNHNIRKLIQKQWLVGQVKIIVATVAFGMGIDKPDVRFVIHYNLPSSVEGYYQEIGRAGRDGKPSDCILYYSYQDKLFYDRMIRQNKKNDDCGGRFNTVNNFHLDDVDFIETKDSDGDEAIEEEKVNVNVNTKSPSKEGDHLNYQLNKLNEMINFIENVIDCRHYQLSTYFGEKIVEKPDWCLGACDNCIRHKSQSNLLEKDLTQHASKIIEVIKKLKSDSPKQLITRKLLNNTYQKFASVSYPATMLTIERLVGRMIGLSLIKENLVLSDSGLWFEDINLTDLSDTFFADDTKSIKMLVSNAKNSLLEHLVVEPETNKEDGEIKKKKVFKPKTAIDHLNGFNFENNFGKKTFSEELLDESLQEKYNLTHLPLYNKLLEYRSEEAKRQKIAPYRIFNNQTLEEIVKSKPLTDKALKLINGIGDAKIKEFGKDIIRMVSTYQ
jgi:bloom syndrome protein